MPAFEAGEAGEADNTADVEVDTENDGSSTLFSALEASFACVGEVQADNDAVTTIMLVAI
ncbi:hypothetical protein GCM10007362_35840 [Saccharibacillus endophyticus]|uniref:Uncharacterized protein n=1 Tax=Saccharibacillus endophyticus TaxID=2060666 RepID=A0ABQ2A2G1_9BACL|nr:hypothetical protein GCM10007362_35840 [Saccharibacillus endophyticus]